MSGKYFHQSYRRKFGTRVKREKILIVCEGKKTEPNYFRKFPVDKEIVEVDIQGTGCVADSLIEKAIELKENADCEKRPYNQVWCVFDRDSNPPYNFNRAFQLANQDKIRIAYSNEAFELWYVLHFNYHIAGSRREWYLDKLDVLLGQEYKKNSPDMYDRLKSRQQDAINNAERLLQSYPRFTPEQNNPSTTVHKLVQELNRYK
jgi:hypothetical protein